MIKNFNNLTRVASLSLILLAVLIISSCKRDAFDAATTNGTIEDSKNSHLKNGTEITTSNGKIEAAKNWYLKTTKVLPEHDVEVSIKSTKDAFKVKKDILWNIAESYRLSDGTEIIGVPMNIKLFNGKKTKGNFFLLITKVGIQYQRMVVSDLKKDYSNESIASLPAIEGLYKNAVNLKLKHNTKSSIKNARKGVLNAQEEECYDYYWFEYCYDANGNIIAYYEEYLWTECISNGAGGGGGGGSGEETTNWGQPTQQDEEVTTTEIEDGNPDTRKLILWYKWTFHWGFETFWLRSFERGDVTETIFEGQPIQYYTAFTHLNQLPMGVGLGKSIKIDMISPPEASHSLLNAQVFLYYRIEETTSVEGLPIVKYSGSYQKTGNFALNAY